MQARALGNALAIALISILLMFGALSISLVEFTPEATPTLTSAASFPTLPVASPILEPTMTSVSMTIMDTPTETISPTPTITATLFSACPIPYGWIQIVVQQYDTLGNIATRYNTNTTRLRDGNCLLVDILISGTTLYVPPLSQPPVSCTQGLSGWVKNYTVRSGDTLYSIAIRYGTSASTMRSVNCRSGDVIYTGEILWVPMISATIPPPPSSTPIPGDTAIPYPTAPLTETPLPFTITPIPSPVPNTPTPIPTVTPSITSFP